MRLRVFFTLVGTTLHFLPYAVCMPHAAPNERVPSAGGSSSRIRPKYPWEGDLQLRGTRRCRRVVVAGDPATGQPVFACEPSWSVAPTEKEQQQAGIIGTETGSGTGANAEEATTTRDKAGSEQRSADTGNALADDGAAQRPARWLRRKPGERLTRLLRKIDREMAAAESGDASPDKTPRQALDIETGREQQLRASLHLSKLLAGSLDFNHCIGGKTLEGRVVAGRQMNDWILECALAAGIRLLHPFHWRYPEDETQLFPWPKDPPDGASGSKFAMAGDQSRPMSPAPSTPWHAATEGKASESRYSSFDHLLQYLRGGNTRGGGTRSGRDDMGRSMMRSLLASPITGRGKLPIAMSKLGL